MSYTHDRAATRDLATAPIESVRDRFRQSSPISQPTHIPRRIHALALLEISRRSIPTLRLLVSIGPDPRSCNPATRKWENRAQANRPRFAGVNVTGDGRPLHFILRFGKADSDCVDVAAHVNFATCLATEWRFTECLTDP